MPTISMFYGILIKMLYLDVDQHHLPHVHVEYQGQKAVYDIENGNLLAGSLSNKQHKLVVAWIEIHQDELIANWSLAVTGKSVFKIKGLE